MTAKLASAAQNARYLLQVYSAFDKPIPASMLSDVCNELTAALVEYRGQPSWDGRHINYPDYLELRP